MCATGKIKNCGPAPWEVRDDGDGDEDDEYDDGLDMTWFGIDGCINPYPANMKNGVSS